MDEQQQRRVVVAGASGFVGRYLQDAFRAEAAARTEAMRMLTRIRIDSHELWIGDAEDAAKQ